MALYQGENKKQTKSIRSDKRFLVPSNNLRIIAERIQRDDNLCKYLTRYDVRPGWDMKDVTLKERGQVLKEKIRTIPVLEKDTEIGAFIILSIGTILPMEEGLSYNISFDVLCNTEIWKLDDYNTRPLAIMNRIDYLFSDTKVKGIGKMAFLGATPLKINEKMLGYTMLFNIGEIG